MENIRPEKKRYDQLDIKVQSTVSSILVVSVLSSL